MANNDYASGLKILLGESAVPKQPQSPEDLIKTEYDDKMNAEQNGFDQLLSSVQMAPTENPSLDAYTRGLGASQMQAEQYAGQDRLRYGPAPGQQIVDPAEMISSPGQRVERGLKAGWGDLVSGTGDTIDWISAAVKPGEGDLTTSVGSYLKKVGTEYQNENALILSEDLQEIEWHDMFDGEFWNSKISRLVPYALSFVLPSGAGAVGATRMLGRFGPTMLKSMKDSGKFGRMSRGSTKGVGAADISKAGTKGFKGQAGTGVLGHIGVDLGKQGYKPTKFLRNTTAFIGAGTAGNLAEGAYLSGEAYQEMINEVDENGQPMFTPKEAAHHAAGVMVDNAAWIGVDAMQYALLFGGLGRGVMGRLLKSTVTKKPFGDNMKALTGMLARRVADTPVAATYLGVEGLTEGFQEAFQEWAKYAEIQEAKGEDWDSWTTWLKKAPFGEDSGLRDIFWSSVGLGSVMGGARGYYDAYAERKKKLDNKIDGWNNIIELAKEGERNPRIYQKKYGEAIDNSLANTVWDYYGDGSVAMAMIDNYVKDKLMTEELAEERKSLIENMEKMYEKHTINSGLTEAGAKQAFNVEVVLSDLNRQENELKERYQGWIKQQKEIFKNDKDKLNEILEQGEIEFKGEYRAPVEDEVSLESIRFQKDQYNQRLEDIYARRLDQAPVAKSTGKRDARFKEQGLSKEDFETYTQEGEKQKTEREKAEADAKAEEKTGIFETVKDLGGKAVEGVKGLFGKAKESQAWKDMAEATKGVATKSWAAMGEALKKGAEKRTESMARRMVIEEGKKRVNRTNYSKVIEEIKNNKINSAKQILKKGVVGNKEDLQYIKDLYNVDDAGANSIIDKILDNDIKKIKEKLKENPNLTGEEFKELIIKEITSEKGKKIISSLLNKVKERFREKDTKKTEEEIIDVEYEDVTEKDGVKKKDQRQIIPKTKEYKTTEESLEKGPRQIKKADIQKGTGSNYFIKTPEGETIQYRDFDNTSDKYVLDEDANVELRLKKPVKGQEGVVEVDGKLYFQFDNLLYETEIEVVINNEVVGKVAQRDFKAKEPLRKAKKKDKRKIDQLIGAVKESKEKIKKYFTRAEKEIPNYEPSSVELHPLYRYGSGIQARTIVEDIVQKRFPGAKGFVAYTALTNDFGEEASSLAIGSTIFINEDSVRQSDIIHEAGHIYYGLMENTPLMKKIKKLLPKSELYQKTKQDYPELILMKFKDLKGTLGHIYKQIDNNSDTKKYTSDILDIVENLALAEKAGDSTRINELFISLRTQLKLAGGKDIRVDQQRHLLEETFTRTLESFSYGTVDAVVKGSAAQKQLEKDLIKFYKETKKLATEEEARKLLDLSVKNIAGLDLEAAIKHILLDFNSGERTVPYMMNSAYGPIKRTKKTRLQKTTSYAAVSSYIADFIGSNLGYEQIADKVMQAIADDSNLNIKDELLKDTKDYITAIIAQLKRPGELKKADTILDKELSAIGIEIKEKRDDDNQEGDQDSGDPNDINKRKNKDIALPTTTTNFIKKIVEVHNHREDDQIKTKKLLAALMSLAKDTRENPMDFPNMLRASTNPNIIAMLNVLDRIYKNDKALTNAKLMEIKGPIEGINIEVLAHNVLTIGDDGKRYWSRYASTSATIEQGVITNIAEQIKENKENKNGETIVDRIAAIYNELFLKGFGENRNLKDPDHLYAAGYKVLDVILDENPRGSLIDKDVLLNTEILFKGKRQSLTDILFGHTLHPIYKTPQMKYENFLRYKNKKEGFSDEINNRKVMGLFHGTQGELKTILLQGLVASRGVNYLSMVDNVEQDGVSVFNKENGLHNRAKNIEDIISNEIALDENDIMHYDNNIYIQMALRKKGKKAFHFTVHSGMMRRIINDAIGLKNKEGRERTLNDLNPNELTAGDFFMFLNKYNQGIRSGQQNIFYDQPIAVFSDKSRRYYIESIAAHDAKSRKALLSRIANNPVYKEKAKYKGYKKALSDLNKRIKEENIGAKKAAKMRENLSIEYTIFPYTIENNKIKEMPALIRAWQKYANKNKELFLNNEDLKEVINPETKKVDKAVIEAFLTSYIANKFMAQQLFIHDHRQSKDQVDYIKRAAGAIASHVVFDRNTTTEFVVTKDYYVDEENNIYTEKEAKEEFGDKNWKDKVSIENDAMGYVLPEQAEFIRAKYGEAQKVGNVFKFVYHYTQLEGPQKGRTTYMKFAVHTLTPELEAQSLYFKNIGDILRARKKEIDTVSKGGLVIAASESAAKLYSGGDNVIHDIGEDYNMSDILTKQDEIYGGDGKYQGLSGEGLGIQLELDKQTDERFFPSQLFYNLLSNITPENQATINRMLELRQNVMEANNASRNANLIMNDKATEKTVLTERDSFKSSVTAEVFDVLVDNTYDNLDPRYPYLNAVHNAVATGRITHKGTKMYTKGSIGYQSSSLGMGLKSYEKGLYKGEDLKEIKAEDIVASEAIVPGYLYDQGVRIGDLFIGTRVPAHGKVSSSIFVVKDFHKQIGDSPTSNVTIPALVSKNWGADLDGDSVHMNFKWTPAEVAKKEWRADSNEFFDLYVELASKKEIQKEIQADIDFVKPAENAIELRDKTYGVPELSKESQLTPWGDAQMFEDNVPAKHLVGMVAALQRSFNVFSNSRDELPFAITIKGESEAVTRETFFDDVTLENGVGNWYGVAQLLNIVLDNAKHQYASKLGLDMQSVFPFVLLRRLGYSLNDLAVLFNSPIVKKYMESKRNSSKDYISKHSDIMDMFIKKDSMNENQLLKFAKDNQLGFMDIKGFLKTKPGEKPSISINLKSLKNTKTAQKQAILMLYTLDKFKEAAVDPLAKAFTVHQSIEKNPLELREIRQGITKAQQLIEIKLLGAKSLFYSFTEKTKTNNIIEHATGLFDSMLQRAERTDIRYTPYMQKILFEDFSVDLGLTTYQGVGRQGSGMQKLNTEKYLKDKSEIINQIIANNLRGEFSMLPSERKDQETLIKEFKELQEREKGNNYFLDNVIQVSDKGNYIVLNRAEITEFTSYKAIEQIKESFADLRPEDKDLIFEIEAEFNRFGLAGGAGKATSFTPFFDNEYTERINDEMSRIIEKNQTRLQNEEYSELHDAIRDVEDRKAGRNQHTLNKRMDKASKDNNNIEIEEDTGPVKKPKKVITADTSYNNDHLGSGVDLMPFDKWLADKGIDINKIEEGSKTYRLLTEKYNKYRGHLKLVREFELTLEKKPLSKYTIEGLYDRARKFRKMDNSATKGIAYRLEKEIGQRAFQKQAKYLRDVGASKGYEYNIPGVDGVAQDDLTNFQAWLGSNNMTSKRPEIQYLINEAQKEYRKYLKSFTEHKNLIEEKNNALKRSKLKGLSILERVRKGFDSNARYEYIYGNIATVENGNVRLYTPEEIVENGVDLTKEEEEYYIRYKAVAEILLGSEDGQTIIPGTQMGTVESMSRSGLFGLYSSSIDSYDYNRVKVRGTDINGNDALKTFYEWKYDVYKGRTGKIRLKSGKEIYELDKLRRKAKQLKAKGIHEDNTKIMLSDMEYDALVNNGAMLKRMIGYEKVSDIDAELIQEYERRKGVRSQNISYDINNALLEFTRSHLFHHGEGMYKMEDGEISEREDRFAGMGKVAILTDSIIGFNKNLDNKNAVRYLTGWWKEGFLEKKQQVGIFGKTGDKVIDSFVRLTSLRLLGFNISIGVGNILAGKYQELRKRGGKQFIKGEVRYWKDFKRSRDMLKEHRVIDYSFDEFIHLSDKKEGFGKIEEWSYMFMDKSERYIQGAAFLGELTDKEFKTGKISEERVMHINHKISTLHGEGYTALDASLLSMYSYGRALLQFKKWFITLIGDRFKAEDIDRFGEVNIGSYRASYEFTTDLFRKYFSGGITKKEIIDMYNNSSEKRKREMRNHVAGIGIGVTLLSLIAMMEDDDEPDTELLRTLKKLSHDVFITNDLRRFVDYTAVPSSYGTLRNANKAIYEAVRGDKVKRTGPYGEKGSSQAMKTIKYEVSPFAESRKDLANLLYEGSKEKNETSSLIR